MNSSHSAKTAALALKFQPILFFGFAMAAMAILWAFPGITKDACAASRREKHAAVSPAPRHGQIVMKLPAGCKPVVVHGRKFFYSGGDFYQKAKGGFIIVNAPFGALVMNLPYGYTRHIHGGVAYVQYNGTYYRETAHGYTVVAAPAVAENRFQPPRGKTHRVSVSARRLNVRSGPGADFSVVREVRRGNILVVLENAPGWVHVTTPSGTHGWVMQRFVTPVTMRARG